MKIPQTIAATVTRVFERRTVTDWVVIKNDRARMGHWKNAHKAELRADFLVEVDLERIVERLIDKAKNSRSGKAVALKGLISVKRRNVETISQSGNTIPIPEGWSEVRDE